MKKLDDEERSKRRVARYQRRNGSDEGRSYKADWYQKNKARIRAKADAKGQADRQAQNEKRREYRTRTGNSATKAWRAAHKEELAAYRRARYEAHKDEERASNAAYRARRREELNERRRKWGKDNPVAARIYNLTRAARKRNAGGTFTAADLAEIELLQRGRCAMCRARLRKGDRQVDHIKPLAKGGDNRRSNLQLLCSGCNRSKNAKDPIDFARERGLLL